MTEGQICQIAMCTSDLPLTARLYSDIFGFAGAGGRPMWGPRIGLIQDLPTGADTRLSIWWLVGRQDFLQIELFAHTLPVQRPRPAGWRASDLGWTRWGVAVPDFDATLARVAAAGLSTITGSVEVGGLRRVCFVEPGAEVIVEVMEDGPSFPGGQSAHFYDLTPAAAYAAVSVRDLDRTRRLLVGALGMTELEPDTLHTAEHEALWGLAGAQRECAVFRGGDALLEVTCYSSPEPRPPAADHLLSDQGFMNIAVGYRYHPDVVDAYEAALRIEGVTASNVVAEVAGGTYLRLDDRVSLELLVEPRELDDQMGFTPLHRFIQPLVLPTEVDPRRRVAAAPAHGAHGDPS